MSRQAWIAAKVLTIEKAEAPLSLAPKTCYNYLSQKPECTEFVSKPECSDNFYCATRFPGHPGIRHGELHNQHKGLGLDSTEVFRCPPSLTRDVRSFFSCSWQTNPPPLFLACFKSLIGIRRIQVKITWVTQ